MTCKTHSMMGLAKYPDNPCDLEKAAPQLYERAYSAEGPAAPSIIATELAALCHRIPLRKSNASLGPAGASGKSFDDNMKNAFAMMQQMQHMQMQTMSLVAALGPGQLQMPGQSPMQLQLPGQGPLQLQLPGQGPLQLQGGSPRLQLPWIGNSQAHVQPLGAPSADPPATPQKNQRRPSRNPCRSMLGTRTWTRSRKRWTSLRSTISRGCRRTKRGRPNPSTNRRRLVSATWSKPCKML